MGEPVTDSSYRPETDLFRAPEFTSAPPDAPSPQPTTPEAAPARRRVTPDEHRIVREQPQVYDHIMPGRDDEVIRLRGRLLGFATSQRTSHDHDVDYDSRGQPLSFAAPGQRCSACRWFEVRIFAAESELTDADAEVDRKARYLVLTAGKSIVPGEVEMRRGVWTDSPREVIEILTQRRDGKAFLPTPSARVLAQAATWDEDMRDAYDNRAVA